MKNTIITRNIDVLDLTYDQKEQLDMKNIKKFYENYKKEHTYVTISKIANDFLFYCMDIDGRESSNNIKLLQKGLKREFSLLLRKDECVMKYSRNTYKFCDKIVNKKEQIPSITRKKLVSLIKNTKWNFDKDYEKKFKINDNVFLLTNERIKIILALLEKELTLEELSSVINKTTTYYYLKDFYDLGFVDKNRLSNGYRGGSIVIYKLKEEYLIN